MKKVILVFVILYLLGGVWFYVTVIKNPHTVINICPQNITNPSPESCKPQKFTIQEEIIKAFNGIVLWLPMITGAGLRG